MCGEGQPAKILVLRKQNSILGYGKFHYLLIDRSLLELAYGQDIVAISAEGADYGEVATFVRKKAHLEGLITGG